MPLIWILASALGGAYTAEKLGDYLNEKRGIAPQPIPSGGQPNPAGPVTLGLALLGAAGLAWYLARR